MKAMTLLATSIGKNVWFYVQMVNEDVQHLHVYEPWWQRRHLGLQKYTWNTPASKDLSTGKGWRNRPPLSLSLFLSLAFAPLRVLYAHNSGGKKKIESQCKDNSLESSSRVTGCNIRCFLVGGNYPGVFSLTLFQLSLLRSPKLRKVSVNRCQAWREFRINLSSKKIRSLKKYPPKSSHL